MSGDGERALVEAMRAGAATLSAIREATGLKAKEISAIVRRLRYQGKILFGELTLAASMRGDDIPAAAAGGEVPRGKTGGRGRSAPAKGDEPGRGGGDAAASASPPTPRSVTIAEEVKAEEAARGDRRRVARKILTQPLPDAPRGAAIATLVQTLVDPEPSDLVRAVQRVHPEFWARCVDLAERLDVSPFAAFYRALGAGLTVVEAGVDADLAA